MQLVGDNISADKGVHNFVCRGLETGGEVEMMALRDGMLHGEHEVKSIGPLDAGKWWSTR